MHNGRLMARRASSASWIRFTPVVSARRRTSHRLLCSWRANRPVGSAGRSCRSMAVASNGDQRMLKRDPYWWVAAPLTRTVPQGVDKTCDVVIVGAGYTGLSAAITLARAGRSVQVFDRQKPGEGASSRNGGITSGNLRLSFAEMTKRFGDA